MRSFHKLRAYTKPFIPQHLIFVDTETTTIKPHEDRHEPRLIIGVAQYVSLSPQAQQTDFHELVFTERRQFWDWVDAIADRVTDLHLYAHNWSFDFPVLNGFDEIQRYGWSIRAIVEACPPVIIRYHRDGDKLTILDTLNYFRESLASMGESLGQHKTDIDLDNASVDELLPYCRNDVDIVRQCMINLIRFVQEQGISRMTHTVSSLAFQSFAETHLKHDVYIDGNERRVAIARASYFGGRTECFKIGHYKGKFRLIDVNSMYPHVMAHHEYPTKAIARYKGIHVHELDNMIYNYCMTAHVCLNTHLPAFPVKIAGRTCFPVGTFRTFLSTPEILYALAHDMITDVHEIVLYEKAPIFYDYVMHYYNTRLHHKSIGASMFQEFDKKLMNSLYGKFGQTGQTWEPTILEPTGHPRKWVEYDAVRQKRISYMEISGTVYEAVHEPESRDSSPAIAAHVTAYGRILLQDTIDYVGREHVYYGDTDSLLLDSDGYYKMRDKLDDKALGCWSLEGTFDEITIRGPKDYKFGDKERIKGVKKSKVRDSDGRIVYDETDPTKPKMDYVRTHDGLYRQIQFSSLKYNIRENVPDHPVIRHIEKKLNRTYLKGNVGDDGTVSPFALDDGVLVSDSADSRAIRLSLASRTLSR